MAAKELDSFHRKIIWIKYESRDGTVTWLGHTYPSASGNSFFLSNICHQFSGWSALGTFFLSYQILSSLPVFKDAVFLPRSKTNLYQAWNLTDFRLRGLAKDADRVFYHYTSVKILTISPFKFLFGLSPTICNYQLTAALKGNPFERKHMWRPKPTQSSTNFLGKPFVLPPGMKFI